MQSDPIEMQALACAQARAADRAPAAESRQYLTFALGQENYAAPIEAIREIIEVPALTAVPMMPPFLRGVINLRGAVVPVIDLASRFEFGETPIARRTCVVVIEVGQGAEEARQVLGVLVDAVHEVIEIRADAVEAAPALGTRIHPDFISAMAKVGRRLMVVLNLDRVLAQDELVRLIGAQGAR